MTMQRDLATQGPASRLRDALGEFLAAWSRRRVRPAPRPTRHFGAVLVLALCAVVAFVGYRYDAPTLSWTRGLSPPTIEMAEIATRLGLSGYIFALTALVGVGAVLARDWGAGRRIDAGLTQLALRAMFLFDTAAVSGLASQALKHLFGRSRPRLYDVVGPFHFDMISLNASYASFPSGHAVTAFAMATALAYLAPRLTPALFFLAVLVGASRVALQAHYLSDVLAGAGLGVGSAMLLRREFLARRLIFAPAADGIRLRGAGMIWPALKRAAARR